MLINKQRLRRSFVSLIGCGLLLVMSSGAFAQSITSSFSSDKPLQRGMIIALSKTDSTKVEAINSDRAADIHGVIVAGNDAAIAISDEGQKVYVATTGKFDVLVSDQNGAIKSGDYVALSSVSGIGMRSDENQPLVAGKALEDFEGPASAHYLSKATIKDGNGNNREINIGRISLDIVIGKNPLAKNADSVPDLLRRAGESVTGQEVSAPRLYLSFALLITSTAITGSVVYSAVRSGLISIGRNPLSKKSILRSILQMIMIGFIIFFSGLFGVYLILKL